MIHAHLAKSPPTLQPINVTDLPHVHPYNNVVRHIQDIIVKCMEKEPDNRYNTAAGLRHDLTKCMDMLSLVSSTHSGGMNRSASPLSRSNIAQLITGKLRDKLSSDFVIGQADSYARFRISGKMYGIENEHKLLMSAFDRIVHQDTKRPVIVFVSGLPGIGL